MAVKAYDTDGTVVEVNAAEKGQRDGVVASEGHDLWEVLVEATVCGPQNMIIPVDSNVHKHGGRILLVVCLWLSKTAQLYWLTRRRLRALEAVNPHVVVLRCSYPSCRIR